MNNPIAHALEQITLGDPVTFENITMIPLLGPASAEQEPFYLTLDEALAQGWTEITEISEQGSVPELRVINKGAKPVFILDGEELLGAKQNRIVNLSILVPAKTTVTIPVSCVEAGRWRARSRAFSASPRTQYAAGRAKRMAQVTASMQMSGARFSDQAEVWADIAEKSARLGARVGDRRDGGDLHPPRGLHRPQRRIAPSRRSPGRRPLPDRWPRRRLRPVRLRR